MADARSDLLGTPLAQLGLGAAGLVVGGALLFSLIGAVTGGAEGETAPPPSAAATASEPPATADETSPTAASTPEEEATPDAVASTPEATTTPTPTEAPPPAIDPASVTIQVLGGAELATDEDAVISCLEAAGFTDLITGNRAASRYDTTTVFHTAGKDNRAAARQVAAALRVGSVQQQPGNLSEDVPVHVVAGNDGADLC